MIINKNDVIVFQGDSITDGERDYNDDSSYGNGYMAMCACALKSLYPDYNLKIYNKGSSGNMSRDLKARWNQDCLDLKPNIVSILVGINDVWVRYNGSNFETKPEIFRENCEYLFASVKEQGSKLIIIEPFLFQVGTHITSEFRKDLDPKIAILRELAEMYADIYIPMEGIYFSHLCSNKREYILVDGVHPTIFGHRILSKEWLRRVESER